MCWLKSLSLTQYVNLFYRGGHWLDCCTDTVPESLKRIWLDDVNCSGDEASLADCEHSQWGQHDCYHSENVGVECCKFCQLLKHSQFALNGFVCVYVMSSLVLVE